MRLGLARSLVPWKRFLAESATIVAGVLVALAVNSWWQQRQDQHRAEDYLRQLLVDFQGTDRRLTGTIAADSERLKKVDLVVGRALRGDYPPADSLELPTGYNQFEPLTGTVTALVQGGDLRLLRSDSLRFELIKYAALIDATETMLRHTETLIWNSTERVALGRVRHSRKAARNEGNAAPAWGQVDVAGALNDPEIISALQIQAVATRIRILNLRRLKAPTHRIIELIEAELN